MNSAPSVWRLCTCAVSNKLQWAVVSLHFIRFAAFGLLRKCFASEFACLFCSQRSSSGPSSSSAAAAAVTRNIPGYTPTASLVGVATAQNQRIQVLEEELKRLHEVADSARASATRTAERERFILEEISKASAAMLCKLYPSPRVYFEWFPLLLVF
jgi:hypothetical protein